MALKGKSPSSTYKSLLKVADETNGVSASLSDIEDGDGNKSCLSVSDDQFNVVPENDNTTSTLKVGPTGGGTTFSVDTSNERVKCGATATDATTNIIEFAINESAAPTAGTHYMIPVAGVNAGSGNARTLANGTGTDPDTTFSVGTFAQRYMQQFWKVPYNITIDKVKVMITGSGTTDKTMSTHLYSYRISNDGDTADGDVSTGTLRAHGDFTAVDNGVIKQADLTIDSADVNENLVLAFFVENQTNTDIISARATVVYHFR